MITYTCSFGKKDTVFGKRDVVFSNQRLFVDPKRESGFYKTFNPLYGTTLWMDANFRLKVPLNTLKKFSKYDLVTFKAIDHDCTYIEAQAVKKLKLDNPLLVDKQMDYYKLNGFPEHYGMIASSCLLRKDNDRVRKFNALWGKQVTTYSKRDQLSFNFCLWCMEMNGNPLKIGYFEGNWLDNPYFERRDHIWKGSVICKK